MAITAFRRAISTNFGRRIFEPPKLLILLALHALQSVNTATGILVGQKGQKAPFLIKE
jgi:hypothetical protein